MAVQPLTEDQAIQSDTVVWVGSLACGCRPFSVVERASAMHEADEAFGILLGQSVKVEVYSVEDAAQIVAPCTHNVAEAGA